MPVSTYWWTVIANIIFSVFISHFSFVWIVRSDINVFDPSPRISKHFAEKSLQPFSSQHLDVFHSKLRVRFFPWSDCLCTVSLRSRRVILYPALGKLSGACRSVTCFCWYQMSDTHFKDNRFVFLFKNGLVFKHIFSEVI